jgi:tripartite-type tricarboxylate transporter receptor subunit TctC
VTILVPFLPDGVTDAFARQLFAMTKIVGRQFVIDDKGGAGGTGCDPGLMNRLHRVSAAGH